MKSVSYIGVDGSVWPLTSTDHAGVFLQATPDELKSEEDGEPITGSLDLVVADHLPDGTRMDDVREIERRWRSAWSTRQFGTLRVDDDEWVDHWVRMKLAAPIAGFPEVDPEGYVEFSQSVVAESPVWWRTKTYLPGTVQVSNSGDVDGWTRVRWESAGRLVMPSGAIVDLPSVSAPRTVLLDPHESCVVLDDSGVVDEVVWRQLRGRVFPEIVPVGEARRFTVPDKATLIFDEGVVSPW